MAYILESGNITEYLKSDDYINFSNVYIQNKAKELFQSLSTDTEKIRAAFEFVRDEISHSADIDSEKVTKTASEVLEAKEGICMSKALLLAALLRCAGIPAGLCYQRLTKGDSPEFGYSLHGLNAVYLKEKNKWIRLDARGNKDGINAQFSEDEEKLAYPIRSEYGELDYRYVFSKPNFLVVQAMKKYNHRKNDVFELSDLVI